MTLQLLPTHDGQKLLDQDEPSVYPLLRQRISAGGFTDDTLAWHQILQLLQAARYAPSSHNSQPWHFIVVLDGPGRKEINDDLTAWGASWAAKAPVLIAVITELKKGTRNHGLNYALFDCELAVQNILLQATSMGLAAHPVGFKDSMPVQQALDLDSERTLLLFIAVGMPNTQPQSTEAARLRKPLATIAVKNHWGGVPIVEDEVLCS